MSLAAACISWFHDDVVYCRTRSLSAGEGAHVRQVYVPTEVLPRVRGLRDVADGVEKEVMDEDHLKARQKRHWRRKR
jgi:hypothetical protein